MEQSNNIVSFKPKPKEDDSDLYVTGTHLVSALRAEFEKQDLMTQGLSFSFDMLIYGLTKDRHQDPSLPN